MTYLLGLFADNILPIMLVAAAGLALQRMLRLDPYPFSRLAFYVTTPALVFWLLIGTHISPPDILRMMAFTGAAVLGIGLLSLLVAKGLRLKGETAAAFILASTFMNSGNYGLSLNHFAFGEEALAWASIFYIAGTMLTNSVGVLVATAGRASPWKALAGLARVPSMYAIPAALIVRSLGGELPYSLSRPVELLASAAVPLMILILGMQLGHAGLPKERGLLAGATALRLIAAPAMAWGLAILFQLSPVARQAGILEAAMPTAVLNTVIALEYRIQPAFVTGAVLVSTLVSPLTITPLIALLGGS
ncbi:MAG: AEC family transporter [Chloroflexi bacterium]|nr:AEC family transporter [Chloroflexota bacterium]